MMIAEKVSRLRNEFQKRLYQKIEKQLYIKAYKEMPPLSGELTKGISLGRAISLFTAGISMLLMAWRETQLLIKMQETPKKLSLVYAGVE